MLRKFSKVMAIFFSSGLFVLIASIVVGVLLQGETSDVPPDFTYIGFVPPNYSTKVFDQLKGKVLLNLADVAASVNFSDFEKTPYPSKVGYDTKIDVSVDCYVQFQSFSNRSAYTLHSLTPEEARARNASKTVYLTHENHCGVCSSLDDLALYLRNRI